MIDEFAKVRVLQQSSQNFPSLDDIIRRPSVTCSGAQLRGQSYWRESVLLYCHPDY